MPVGAEGRGVTASRHWTRPKASPRCQATACAVVRALSLSLSYSVSLSLCLSFSLSLSISPSLPVPLSLSLFRSLSDSVAFRFLTPGNWAPW